MNKELEALLLTAAKAIGYGVSANVDSKRAKEWGVPVAGFIRDGEPMPGTTRRAKAAGYYCHVGFRPKHGCSLALDQYSPGDGWTRYSLAVLGEDSTGHSGFSGRCASLTLAEMKAYLRGVADGAGNP